MFESTDIHLKKSCREIIIYRSPFPTHILSVISFLSLSLKLLFLLSLVYLYISFNFFILLKFSIFQVLLQFSFTCQTSVIFCLYLSLSLSPPFSPSRHSHVHRHLPFLPSPARRGAGREVDELQLRRSGDLIAR